MAKRIFEIAKELGVKSKAIREKCIAEGIPEDKVKNHMASISLGLEASIREWFSTAPAEEASAVQNSAKVDLAEARVAPKAVPKARAKAKAKIADEPAEAAASATAVVTLPESPPTSPPPAAPAPGAGDNGDSAHAVEAPPTPPAPARIGEPAPATPAAPAPEPESAPPETVDDTRSAAASADSGDEAPPADTGDRGGEGGAPAIVAAPKNVPSRPKVITPAGPQLEVRSPVKLSGPKVVRVEAPEPVGRPKQRRDGPPRGPQRGGGGGGAGPMDVPMPGGGDDRTRSPRRTRKGGPPGGGGGGATPRQPARRAPKNQEGLGTGIFREQDLLERQSRLERSSGFMKQRRREQRAKRAVSGERATSAAEAGGSVRIEAPFTIKDLSAATGVKGGDIVKRLFQEGVMSNINSVIDSGKAEEIMIDYGIELDVVEARTAEQQVSEEFESLERVDVEPRSPVVTILGHVDHGKTSLLDRIRNAKVAEGEAGGITQATSAFRVPVSIGDDAKQVVFLDTPGHQAFTEMRARGANMTDIVILVVAADDGVMPQTIESISHAKAAGVPLIVALNKCDRPEATDTKMQEIYGQLAEHGLNPVPWGGDIEVIRTSALTGEGVDDLLEVLDLQGQVLELTAGFGGPARGTVIEAQMQPGRGATANLLVQDGRLKVGDFIVVGRGYGRVRDIRDDHGKSVTEVGPAHPVQISGLDEVPDAGDRFYIVDSLKKAQEAAEHRRQREREAELSQPKLTLDTMLSQLAESDVKELRIVLKADVQGSVDVLKNEIEKISTEEVRVRVLHTAVGGISESDVTLAQASGAIIIGFNVIAPGSTRSLADRKGVEIRNYQVIYHITEDLVKAAEGLLEPELREEVLGHAEVRAVFKISKVGSIAGCYITDGVVEREAKIRVTRDNVVIENDRVLEQLKRHKDDAKEVRSGNECGMKIVGYDDIKEGDVLECYKTIEVKRKL